MHIFIIFISSCTKSRCEFLLKWLKVGKILANGGTSLFIFSTGMVLYIEMLVWRASACYHYH